MTNSRVAISSTVLNSLENVKNPGETCLTQYIDVSV